MRSSFDSSTPDARPLDRGILLVLFALFGIGLVQVYSSSFIFAFESRGDGLFFFKRQLVFSFLAFGLLLAVAQIPWKILEKWGPLLWGVAIVLVLATFVPGLSHKAGGAARWIQISFLRFEPSELLKVALPVAFAALLCAPLEFLGSWKWPFRLAIVLAPLSLLLKQPDFGTFAIGTVVVLTMLFCFGMQRRYIVGGIALVIPLFYFLVIMVPYRRARLMAFLDPWSDPGKSGFQVIQSMLSLYSGGFWGSGLGQGQGKLFFLPEAHTDFTLAVLGEELGFAGIIFVLLLYGYLIFRGFQISIQAHSKFAQALALGLTVTFALHIVINMGVVMGLLPTKGLTLPFLSYGGSSLVMAGLSFGILLNIARFTLPKQAKMRAG